MIKCSKWKRIEIRYPAVLMHMIAILRDPPWVTVPTEVPTETLPWRHNELAGVSNHQPRDCLLNRLIRRRSKKISKLRVTGLCAMNSPGTGVFPAQRASYAENDFIWWRHHGGTPKCQNQRNKTPTAIMILIVILVSGSFDDRVNGISTMTHLTWSR